MSMHSFVARRKAVAAVPAAGLAMILLTGCGSGSTAAASSAGSTTTTGNTAAGAGNNGTGRTFPGANGQIAEVDGKTLQVQSSTAQTAVTYTASTKLTKTVAGTVSNLAVGKCISVRSADTGTSTATDDSTPVAASSVTISDPVNGACAGGPGGGFGGGQPPSGQAPNGQAPTGTTAANGQAGGNVRGMGNRGVNGLITAISGDTVTVQAQQPQFNQTATGTAASTTPTVTTVTRTVTLSSATTYTKTASASASDLTVGKCVTALGSTGTDGTLAATSIALRAAENGTCNTGFGGPGGGTAPTSSS